MQPPAWQSQGTHRYYREADLLFVELHGVIEREDIRLVYERSDDIERDYGYLLVLFDSRDSVSLSAAARQYTGERNRRHTPLGALAIVGASFGLRAMVLLLSNASRLMGRISPPIQFYTSIDEAKQWLDIQRQRQPKRSSA